MTVSTETQLSALRPDYSKLPQAALIGAILGIIGNMIILFVGRGLGTEFMLVPPFGSDLEALPFFPVVIAATVGPAIVGAALLVALNMITDRPYIAFWVISIVFTVLSFLGPLQVLTDSSQTVIGLNAMHVWTALAIVGALTALGTAEE